MSKDIFVNSDDMDTPFRKAVNKVLQDFAACEVQYVPGSAYIKWDKLERALWELETMLLHEYKVEVMHLTHKIESLKAELDFMKSAL